MNAKRYASALWALFGLFVLRVVAQLLIALGDGSFLPPWDEWFSGALSYPWLLASQIAIIVSSMTGEKTVRRSNEQTMSKTRLMKRRIVPWTNPWP